jgi:hypothetical protein
MKMKRKIFKRQVIQPFTDERRNEILTLMSKHAASMAALSKKKKDMIKSMNKLISRDRRAMDVIEDSLCDNGDHVQTDCYFRMDFPNKKKHVIRMDTGEQIGEEPLQPEDFQQDIEDAVEPEGPVDAWIEGNSPQDGEDSPWPEVQTEGSSGDGDPGAG